MQYWPRTASAAGAASQAADGALMGNLCGKPATLATRLPGRHTMRPALRSARPVGGFLARCTRRPPISARLRHRNPRGLGWWQATLRSSSPVLPDDAFARRLATRK